MSELQQPGGISMEQSTHSAMQCIGDLIAHIGHLPTSQGLLHIGIINSIELVSSSVTSAKSQQGLGGT